MKKISVIIAGRHQTSITLEEEFYEIFKKIAQKEQKSLSGLITEIDSTREQVNLSSAIRVYILKYLQNELTKQSNE